MCLSCALDRFWLFLLFITLLLFYFFLFFVHAFSSSQILSHFYAIMLVVAHIWYVSRQTDLWLHEARVVGGCWDNMFSYTCLEDLCAFRVSESSCQKTVEKEPYIPHCMFSTLCMIHHCMLFPRKHNFVFVIFHQIVTICSASETTFLLMWLRMNGFNQ